MARRGQIGWICTRESIVVSERGGFVHVGWSPLIIVDFHVVITDTITGFAASHRAYVTSADRQPRPPDCLSVHGVGSEDGLAVQTEDFTTFVEYDCGIIA